MKKRRLGLVVVVSTWLWLSMGCGARPVGQAAPAVPPVVAELPGVKAVGRLEPVRYVELASGADGLVSEVMVSEDDQVEAGQLIARLDSSNAKTLEEAQTQAAVELADAYVALRVAQAKFDDYPVPRVFVGMSPEEAARKWLKELYAAREAFAPYKDTSRKALKPSHVLSRFVYPSMPHRVRIDTHEYDDWAKIFKKRVDIAWMNYRKAVTWVNLDSAVTTAKASVAESQRRYASLQGGDLLSASVGTGASLATAEIRAPFAGTITNLKLKVGEVVQAGTDVATVADPSGWVVKTTDLTEVDVTRIQEGMAAAVIFDSMPGLVFRGRVISIDFRYTYLDGKILFPVSVLLTDSNPGLRWGMTADVIFGK